MDEVGRDELVSMAWDILNKLMIIGSMGKVTMSFYGDFCLSTLMILIVMKSSSLLCLYLVSV